MRTPIFESLCVTFTFTLLNTKTGVTSNLIHSYPIDSLDKKLGVV